MRRTFFTFVIAVAALICALAHGADAQTKNSDRSTSDGTSDPARSFRLDSIGSAPALKEICELQLSGAPLPAKGRAWAIRGRSEPFEMPTGWDALRANAVPIEETPRALMMNPEGRAFVDPAVADVSDLERLREADRVRLTELERAQDQLRAMIGDLRAGRNAARCRQSRAARPIARPELKLADIESQEDAFLTKLDEATETTARRIEKLIEATGLKVEDVVEAPRTGKSGQGGPFKAMSKADLAAFARATASDESDIEARMTRLSFQLSHLDGLQNALTSIPLRAPLAKYEISSGFGPREDPFTGKMAMHEGVDLTADRHTRVHATAAGYVSFAGRDGAYGKMVEIDHGHGISTRYGHLDRIDVKEGEHVEAGAVVGLLGNTGRSTGSHVHYEVLLNGKPRNPEKFLEAVEHVFQK